MALLVAALLLLAVVGEGTKVQQGTYRCTSRIGIDSATGLESGWAPQFPSESGDDVTFAEVALSDEEVDFVTAMWGSTRALVLFDLPHSAAEELRTPGCATRWDPRVMLPPGASIVGAQIAIIGTPVIETIGGTTISGENCTVQIMTSSTNSSNALTTIGGGQFRSSRGTAAIATLFGAATVGDALPLRLRTPVGCRVRLVLFSHRYGDIEPWYKWALLLAYAIVVLPMPFVLGDKAMQSADPRPGIGLLAALFFGFLGCCIGLAVELASWRALVSYFPFPHSVTLFVCSAAAFGLSFAPILWRHACRSLLIPTTLRMFVYGLGVAALVGFWVRGFVVLGTVGLVVVIVCNAQTTQLYLAYKSELEDHSEILDNLVQSKLPSGSGGVDEDAFSAEVAATQIKAPSGIVTGMLWAPPTLPFAPIVLTYAELVLAQNEQFAHLEAMRLLDAMCGIRFVMGFSIPMTVLVAIAAAFHTAFIVLLLAILAVGFWDAFSAVGKFFTLQRAYKLDHGRLADVLWPAIASVFSRTEETARSRSSGTRIATDAVGAQNGGASRGRPPIPSRVDNYEVELREAALVAAMRTGGSGVGASIAAYSQVSGTAPSRLPPVADFYSTDFSPARSVSVAAARASELAQTHPYIRDTSPRRSNGQVLASVSIGFPGSAGAGGGGDSRAPTVYPDDSASVVAGRMREVDESSVGGDTDVDVQRALASLDVDLALHSQPQPPPPPEVEPPAPVRFVPVGSVDRSQVSDVPQPLYFPPPSAQTSQVGPITAKFTSIQPRLMRH